MATQVHEPATAPAHEPGLISPFYPMTSFPGLRIGDAVNLLYGFHPIWDVKNPYSFPVYKPPCTPLTTFSVNIVPDANAAWSLPAVTLHDDLEELLSQLFEYVVLPFGGDPNPFSVPVGPLMLGDSDRDMTIRAVSEYLGIDLTQNYSYMLVKLRRVGGRSTHEVVRAESPQAFDRMRHLTSDGRKAIVRLRPSREGRANKNDSSSITIDQARQYLEFFYDYGTHFVSSVEVGDIIFQVFAYRAEHYLDLKQAYVRDSGGQAITGEQALSYAYYTSPTYVAAHGHIVSLSRDPVLAETLANGNWHDQRYAAHDSIFAGLTNHPWAHTTFLNQFSSIVPIGFELMPLNRFIEFYRALRWQHVLKGALFQKYKDHVKLPVPKTTSYDWIKIFPDEDCLPSILTPVVDIYRERLTLATIAEWESPAVKEITAYSHILNFDSGSSLAVPGKRVKLISHIIEAPENTAQAPVLQLTEEAYQDFILAGDEMSGVLVVTNQSGTDYRCILAGLQFTTTATDAIAGRSRVDVHRNTCILDSKLIHQIREHLELGLLTAESLLYWQRGDGETRRYVAAYLRWLARILPERDGDLQMTILRIQARWLGQVARKRQITANRELIPGYAGYLSYIKAIAESAAELSRVVRLYRGKIRAWRNESRTAKESESAGKQISALLMDYFRALMDCQQDMTQYDAQILALQQSDVDANMITAEQILETAQQNVQKALRDDQDDIDPQAARKAAELIRQVNEIPNSLQMPHFKDDRTNLLDTEQMLERLDLAMASLSSPEWQRSDLPLDVGLAQALQVNSNEQRTDGELQAAVQRLATSWQAWLEASLRRCILLMEGYFRQPRSADSTHPAQPVGLMHLTKHIQYQERQTLILLQRTALLQYEFLQDEYILPSMPAMKRSMPILANVVMLNQAQIDNQSFSQQKTSKSQSPVEL